MSSTDNIPDWTPIEGYSNAQELLKAWSDGEITLLFIRKSADVRATIPKHSVEPVISLKCENSRILRVKDKYSVDGDQILFNGGPYSATTIYVIEAPDSPRKQKGYKRPWVPDQFVDDVYGATKIFIEGSQ